MVIKKWTNLKDCWWRSLKKGADGSKPLAKPYRYHKDMIFLTKNYLQNGMLQLDQDSDTNGSDNLRTQIVETHDKEWHEPKLKQESHIVEKPEPLPTENRHISFIKGILPTLQLLNEDQVLQFQIEVLKVLHEIKQSIPQDPSLSSSNF